MVAPLAPPLARGMHVPVRAIDAAFLALDETTYFARLSSTRNRLGRTVAVDYEAELFDRADEAITVLQSTAAEPAVRTAAAHYLLYTAMFIKLGNDEALAGRLSLEQMTTRLRFDPAPLDGGRGLRREIAARERFALAALELVARVDRRPIIEGFIATTRARMELQSRFALFSSFDGLIDSLDGGIFNLVSTLAGIRADWLSDAQRELLFERLRSVTRHARAQDAPGRDSLAPWGREVALVLIADACMRATFENRGGLIPLSQMFFSLGPAISMYERALTDTAGEDWPLRASVEERLTLARSLQREIFGARAVMPLRRRFDSLVERDPITCASCHRERRQPLHP